MNKKFTILLIVVVVFVAFFVAKDLIVKSSVEAAAKFATGADVKIGGFSFGFLRQSVRVTNFKMYNPPGFPQDQVMVSIPEVAVRMDSLALLKKELHVLYVRLDLEEVRVIKNKDGKMNVNSLKFAQAPSREPRPEAKSAPETRSARKQMKMQLDVVSLNIGKVVMEDYSRGGTTPVIKEFNINLRNKEFRDITSPAQLASTIMLEALLPVGLGKAFKVGAEAVGDVYATGLTAVKGTGEAVKGTTKAVEGTVKDLFKGVKGIVK
jgi:uncharacterized protein involved in outer membrane biogenesis